MIICQHRQQQQQRQKKTNIEREKINKLKKKQNFLISLPGLLNITIIIIDDHHMNKLMNMVKFDRKKTKEKKSKI